MRGGGESYIIKHSQWRENTKTNFNILGYHYLNNHVVQGPNLSATFTPTTLPPFPKWNHGIQKCFYFRWKGDMLKDSIYRISIEYNRIQLYFV